ncbi:unnamed protein product [Prorocentrum cordatum]|uniref:Saposin B-type domain-containing protein n=1 Tax=Prorocentrum cordatum TaxID=2364126 RepID=A0ABN9TET2_9DINO|nr:unnamed protein product [Polarella glacialis]
MASAPERPSQWARRGALFLGLLAWRLTGQESDDPIPDKVGVQVHLSKTERGALKKLECQMCKAILSEMYEEVAKHDMAAKGESHIWETSNAICLAMLQKWKLDLKRQALERKPEGEEDSDAMANSGDPEAFMRSMLVLKMGCSEWVEDYGGETSGFIYKAVRDRKESASAAAVAQEFCASSVGQCGKESKAKRQKAKEKDRARLKERADKLRVQEEKLIKEKAKDPFAGLPQESQLGLQQLLQQARDDPMAMMDEEAKRKVNKARVDLRCDVCRAVLGEVHQEVQKRPKTMRSETDMLPLFEGACEGGKDLSVPAYFGIEPPPLAPVWTDRVRPYLTKKTKRWTLRPFPSEVAAQERRAWRKKAATGQAKPPGDVQSEEDMMMTLACKDTLDAARMTESLFAQMQACGSQDEPACDAALASARLICRSAADEPCTYGVGDATGAGGASQERRRKR